MHNSTVIGKVASHLGAEDVYYDSIRFKEEDNEGELQYYAWVLHVYGRRLGIENFNDDFEDVYVEVRDLTQNWVREYNEERPHDSLEDLTTWEYLAKHEPRETLLMHVNNYRVMHYMLKTVFCNGIQYFKNKG